MTEPEQPDTADRDVDLPMDPDEGGEVPGNEDVQPDAGTMEPPD